MEEIKNKDNNSRPVTKYQVKDIDMNDYVIPDDDLPEIAGNEEVQEVAGEAEVMAGMDPDINKEGTDAEPLDEAGSDKAGADAQSSDDEETEATGGIGESDSADTKVGIDDPEAERSKSAEEPEASDDIEKDIAEETGSDEGEPAPETSDSKEADIIEPEVSEMQEADAADAEPDLLDELVAGEDEPGTEPDKTNDDNRTRIFNMLRPEIHVAWMYPDTLYLHGERGNIMALVRYGQELGLSVVVHRIDLGTKDFDPFDFDIMFFGPGEISCFGRIMEDIAGYKHSMAEYLASGRILLVTGTTVAMFGERITRFSPDSEYGIGETIDGLCLIPAEAREREYVFGDDLDISAEYGGYSMELVGNQIQMADIDIRENSNFARLGSVIYGRGNNGTDSSEGLVYNNGIFTNMLGPILVGNPWLAVLMLKKAARDKGIEIEFADPAYDIELKSLVLKKEFIDKKRAALTEEAE